MKLRIDESKQKTDGKASAAEAPAPAAGYVMCLHAVRGFSSVVHKYSNALELACMQDLVVQP